ncbi:hypothetical protein VV869_16815 [Photobacterium sp. MCCC 1A19761]|uniref:hypothetical protein n=1 Tax=Photobacterium sp. MCCC 1A19761 TaxID=3115000 RepID=UPI00307EE537
MEDKVVNINKVIGPVFIGDSPEYNVDTAINELLKCIAKQHHEFRDIKRRPSSDTINKISHNNIKSKRHIIKQYLDFSSKVENAFFLIDSLIPFGKQIVIQSLNDLYYEALDEIDVDYFSNEIDIEKIKDNSEFILDYIIQKLICSVYESKNAPEIKEQIELGVNVVVAHAFIECVVLENPS